MQMAEDLSRNTENSNPTSSLSSGRLSAPKKSLRRLGLCTQIATGGQHSSPLVFPEKRSKIKSSGWRNREASVSTTAPMACSDDREKAKSFEHTIDIGGGGDEKTDLLGDLVFSGKLILNKRKTTNKNTSDVQGGSAEIPNQQAIDAKLTNRALICGSFVLSLDDVISVSYNVGLRHFTVHSYPLKKGSFSCFMKPRRSRKDFRFLASSIEEAIHWVGGFADQQCFVNCLPHPLVSSKKQASSELFPTDTPPELLFKCKNPPKMLVILNPRSGRGRSSKVFHDIVEPIFKLAGFKLEVVKTTSAGHARKLASSVDISTCPDGIICVGGDGIINEVLNGLLGRDNQKEGISIPIGIIPAGSDNSLVWTVLGVRDPISAAMAIVKGGLTATDVFAVEWIQSGVIHFGMTVSYYGFVSDVLELSEKYQKGFGPLRYFVAGFLKFLCLPKYSYEIEYLLASKEDELQQYIETEVVDMSDVYKEVMGRPETERIPRASSLSSIDSIRTPSRMSGEDLEMETTCSGTHASTEPSDYVRGIDPKSKRLSSGRSNMPAEAEIIHPQLPFSTTPNSRTRSKSRADKGWTELTGTHDSSRSSWGNNAANDREDISSTLSDPGPIWDAEPKWEAEHNWDTENPIELPGPSLDVEVGTRKLIFSKIEDKWITTKGQFLGILVCNHACRTVQSSQVVAPKSEHDDNTLDLILVHGIGRLRLLRFFVLLQLGKHLSLPYVEYVKVKSVKIKAGKHTHNSCGIDGELFLLNGQVISSLLPEQCRLIGRLANPHL